MELETKEAGEPQDSDSEARLAAYLDEEYAVTRPQRGDILEGEVLQVDANQVLVDIGAKTEGVVQSHDLAKLDPELRSSITEGDVMPVYVLTPENADGDVVVSINLAKAAEDWKKAQTYLDQGESFEGLVSGHNKGGLIVPFGQIRGFVPASHVVDLVAPRNSEERMSQLAELEGRKLALKVIEVDRRRRRLILSQRAALREVREQRKEELLDSLQEGEIRKGRVSSLADFGAFVDLGGADGLIHISELAWQRVSHPREVLSVGDDVEVYVLRVDRERKRIGLSLRRLQPDPWTQAEASFQVGQVVEGTVTNVVEFGAFARIADGIEGLIHASELADDEEIDPREVVREGDVLQLKIISIDSTRQRIGLSLRQGPGSEHVEESAEELEEPTALQADASEEPAEEGAISDTDEREDEPGEPVASEADAAAGEPEEPTAPQADASKEPAEEDAISDSAETEDEPGEPVASETEAAAGEPEEPTASQADASEEPAEEGAISDSAETEDEPGEEATEEA
ncbi:MAG: S1 RNA-binding domain-containing protein [Anaerolineae bacterium]